MSQVRTQLPVVMPSARERALVVSHRSGPRHSAKSALFRLDRLLNVVVAVLIGLAMAATQLFGSRPGTPGPSETLSAASNSGVHVVAEVESGDLNVKVAATGTVEPVRLIEVSTQLSGMVRAVHVENNAVVKAGQLLAELDDEALQHELARAEAQVAVARAKVTEAEALEVAAEQDLTRKGTLARRNLSPQRDLESASASAAQRQASTLAAKAELAAVEAAFAIAQSNLAKSRILSPIDGVVLRRSVEPGQTIAASLQAPVMFRLAQSLERMQIRVDVDEADVLKVKPGQAATFSVQAMRERQLDARVEKVFIGPEIVQSVVTYKAILSFENARLDLKPGMTATAEIVVERVQGGMLVPNAALRFSPPESPSEPSAATGIALVDNMMRAAGPAQARAAADDDHAARGENGRVFVTRNGGLVPVFIRTGASDGVRTVVLSGALRPGHKVVVDVADKRR